MGRGAGRKRQPVLPKVERVELSEKHIGLRFIAFVLCLTLGLCALGFGIYGLMSSEPGWSRIEASTEEAYAAGDFTFDYLLGEDATAQRKVLTTVYTQQCLELGRLFDTTQAYEDCPYNLCYINSHPGEDVKVDPRLYSAFERLLGAGDKTVYLGALEEYYLNLYSERGGDIDPFTDPATAEDFRRLTGFAQSSVRVELLGEDTLRLEVDREFTDFAGELGLSCWLDFGWFRNAFILDCIAEELSARGYTQGLISSRDGYTRSLGGDVGQVSRSLYRWDGERAVETGRRELDTPVNVAALHGFPLGGDEGQAYVYQSAMLGSRAGEVSETALLSGTEDCAGLALELKKAVLKEE